MKTISLIGIAVALCVPALASAQRGGGAGGAGVQRVERVQRVDMGRTTRDIDIGRADAVRGATTGTRIVRRPAIDPSRRRPHNPARRRYYNATH